MSRDLFSKEQAMDKARRDALCYRWHVVYVVQVVEGYDVVLHPQVTDCVLGYFDNDTADWHPTQENTNE